MWVRISLALILIGALIYWSRKVYVIVRYDWIGYTFKTFINEIRNIF